MGKFSIALAPRASTVSRHIGAAMTTTSHSFELSQRRFRSASPDEIQKQQRRGFFPVYVHHVSKIALEHLQRNRSDWVQSQGLESGLHINPNGTFVLSFPAKKGYDAGRIWCVLDCIVSSYLERTRTQQTLTDFRLFPFVVDDRTSYDSLRKQHWLSVYRNNLAVRLLLKDHGHTMSRNIHDSNQTETQILKAVDQLISAVIQTESAASQTAPSPV